MVASAVQRLRPGLLEEVAEVFTNRSNFRRDEGLVQNLTDARIDPFARSLWAAARISQLARVKHAGRVVAKYRPAYS
jgi:hypothetical protein